MRTSMNTRRVFFVDDDAALGKMFAEFLRFGISRPRDCNGHGSVA